jgi:hypothetical protein
MGRDTETLAKSIRRLTLAVWALALVTLASTLWSLGSVFLYSGSFGLGATKASTSEQTFSKEFEKYAGFHKLPFDEQLKQASAVIIAKHSVEGDRLIAKVSEIPCLKSGTRFGYKIGDELRDSGRRVEPNTFYGDGQIVLFTGAEADFRFSSTFTNNRLHLGGNMSLDDFRKEVSQACK